ncbi:hypothetical protein LIA77_03043 [Sarocladium implicatum]|nr:hypothetical protein LIA77_03043 [Sarocladium implicatum]
MPEDRSERHGPSPDDAVQREIRRGRKGCKAEKGACHGQRGVPTSLTALMQTTKLCPMSLWDEDDHGIGKLSDGYFQRLNGCIAVSMPHKIGFYRIACSRPGRQLAGVQIAGRSAA